jgi:putative addiction module CopG family antidote
MTPDLTPHFQQFVRDQLKSGRYRDEGDLIRAALSLLEAQSTSLSSRESKGVAPPCPLSPPAIKSRREILEPRPAYEGVTGDGKEKFAVARRSPRGILADLRSDLSLEDFKDARQEMWSALRRGPTG